MKEVMCNGMGEMPGKEGQGFETNEEFGDEDGIDETEHFRRIDSPSG